MLSSRVAQKRSTPFPFSSYFTPPGDGRPKKTKGAGARDGLRCSEDESMMRAIAPPDGYGLTLQEHPEIWLDLGETKASQVLLLFKSESGQQLERVLLPIQQGEPLQRFTLPKTSAALEVGRNYQWSLLVACDGTINPSHPIFSGWVQRVAPSSEPPSAEPQVIAEQVKGYAQRGYWYDAVSVLQQGLQSNPEASELQELWRGLWKLLNSPPS